MTLKTEKTAGLLSREPGSFLLIALLVTAAYLNSFSGVFQFDDYTAIVNNSRVHSFAGWLADLPRGIRPILKLFWLANWQSGLGLFGFHLVNLVIHLCNTILVYLLAKLLYQGADEEQLITAPFLAAVIFGLHPLQTEAVTYVCGRSVSMMSLFYLGGIYLYLRGRAANSTLLSIWLPLFMFSLALATKETAIVFPLALLLCSRLRTGEREGLVKAFLLQWPSWLLMLVALVAFILHPRYGALLEYSFDIRSWQDNLVAQVSAVSYLVTRFFALGSMNIDPDLASKVSSGDPMFIARYLLLGAMLLTGLLTFRKIPWFSFGILWFFIHLIPTNSIVPRLDIVNDRQAYLPMAGIAITASIFTVKCLQKPGRNIRYFAAFLLVLLLGGFTISRNHDYRSEISLWEDTAQKSPGKARVFNNLGYAYSLANRDKEGCAAYEKAIELDPDYDLAKANFARFCRGDGRCSPLAVSPSVN